jgi:hypothetical protein
MRENLIAIGEMLFYSGIAIGTGMIIFAILSIFA